MNKVELIALLSSMKVEEGDLQQFKEDSWGDNNVDDTADGAYSIGHDDGFNEGLETAIKFIEEHYDES